MPPKWLPAPVAAASQPSGTASADGSEQQSRRRLRTDGAAEAHDKEAGEGTSKGNNKAKGSGEGSAKGLAKGEYKVGKPPPGGMEREMGQWLDALFSLG